MLQDELLVQLHVDARFVAGQLIDVAAEFGIGLWQVYVVADLMQVALYASFAILLMCI